jgi:hypothetical protein
VLEAVDPIQIDLTPMADIYKVFDNLHMQWMSIKMCPHHTTAAHVLQAFQSGLTRILDNFQAITDGKMQ